MATVPDPSQGVFETLLVLDGRPVELDAHLARLESSLETLFPDRAPPDLSQLNMLSDDASRWALRIAVAPDGAGGLAATIEWRPASGHFAPLYGDQMTTRGPSLRSLETLGGLGAHKWADRSQLEQAQAGLPEDSIPLIVDEDGDVLEASRANIFAVHDGALFTPPLDGRILSGVTRMRVLEIAGDMGMETAETGLSRDDLLAAEEVFLTGSVRGIERVDSLDGTTLADGGSVATDLGRELWRTWASAPVG
jgi:para-aminobenzoate synthetase/4-amino-4-deoxychorismate lyase